MLLWSPHYQFTAELKVIHRMCFQWSHVGAIGVVVGLLLIAVYCMIPSYSHWNYTVTGNENGVRVVFEEPNVSVTFVDMHWPEGHGEQRGSITVSGFAFSEGRGGGDGFFERTTYAWGRAELWFNERSITITESGRKLVYGRCIFDLQLGSPFSIVVYPDDRVCYEGELPESLQGEH